jgi:hypothetical protein
MLLPLLSAAQTACPTDPLVLRCWETAGCDLQDRRELVQLLQEHDEQLLTASPDLTSEEQDWYRTETRAGDASRLRAAFESDVVSRLSVRGALAQRRGTLRVLKASLSPRVEPRAEQTTSLDDELRSQLLDGWLLLGQAYADSGWILAWDRVRKAEPAPGTQSPENTLQGDLQACSFATQALLQIALDDLEALRN